nr:hypothetical protein [uncultured Duganella sp.]
MTRFAPPMLYQCPACAGYFTRSVLSSLHFYDDVPDWSDGKNGNWWAHASGTVGRCPACAGIIWLDDAADLMPAPTKPRPIGGIARLWHQVTGDRRGRLREECEWLALPLPIREAESIDRLGGAQDFIDALAALSANETDREINLRRRLWWASNDHLRQHSGDTATTLSPAVAVDVARTNAQRLLELIHHDPKAQVERGELLRQLGRFDEAVAVLQAVKPDGYNEVKAVKIERLALAGLAELRALNTAPMGPMDSGGNSIQGAASGTEEQPKHRFGDRAEDYDIPAFLRHKTRHQAGAGDDD